MGEAMKAKSKYRAIPTVVDGIRFASKLEAKRYGELTLLEIAGEISELVTHVKYDLHVNGKKIGAYIPDFVYLKNGMLVIEDTKSAPTVTPLYRWKKKHLMAEYGINVMEITK